MKSAISHPSIDHIFNPVLVLLTSILHPISFPAEGIYIHSCRRSIDFCHGLIGLVRLGRYRLTAC